MTVDLETDRMKIGELAERTGLTQKTIHFYERSGLIEPAFREGTGYRYYNCNSISRLELIARLKSIGLTLEEIKEILPLYERDAGGIQGKAGVISVLRRHLKQVDGQIATLQGFRDEIIGSINKLEMFLAQAKGDQVSVLTPVSLRNPEEN